MHSAALAPSPPPANRSAATRLRSAALASNNRSRKAWRSSSPSSGWAKRRAPRARRDGRVDRLEALELRLLDLARADRAAGRRPRHRIVEGAERLRLVGVAVRRERERAAANVGGGASAVRAALLADLAVEIAE